MGGGDLNLKKSWHPSTMRNMEKVWKAEQKHDQEKKRIAELQREIQTEKDREDITKYAEDQGVLEKKKGDVKLDWMYKGPGGSVNHEEYLLGKAIDKGFEQLQRTQPTSSSVCVPGRTDSCLPSSIFAGSGEQVDVARKLQEDPLFAIRKKELETRSEILKNPVKLKQLKEMITKQKSKKTLHKHKKEKKKKKKKRKKSKRSSSSSESGDDLDAKLLAKYKMLKEKLGDNPIAMLQESQPTSENEEKKKNKRSYKSSSESEREEEEEVTQPKISHKSYGLVLPHGARNRKSSTMMPLKENLKKDDKSKSEEPCNPPAMPRSKKLSEEEKERRRQEMLANAAWREKERESNVSRYREADKRENSRLEKDFNEDFLRQQLSKATAHSSVASRIKSNINNIQRSGGSMDKHFARR